MTTMSWDDAIRSVTGPGQLFELVDAEVRGVPMQVFRHAPANLGLLFANMRGFADRTFLVYEDERISFADAADRMDGLANALVHRYGVRPGDRVAIAMRNYPEWVLSFGAIVSVGAISVSMNSWWTAPEMDYALRDSAPTVLLCDEQRLDAARATCEALGIRIVLVRPTRPVPAGVDAWADVVVPGASRPEVQVGPDDDATILYTSGTTGFPKGAVSTHRAVTNALMAFSARTSVDNLRTPPATADSLPPSFILIVPLFHVTGCVPVMLSCVAVGLKLVIMYKWDPEKALELIERERITNFVGVPTQSWDLVNSPAFARHDTSSLRAVGGGGAPAPATLVHTVADRVKTGGPNLGYGMTETNAYGPGNRGADYLARPTSTGRCIPPMRVQVRDDGGREVARGEAGEIWFFGPMLIRGYWNKPEATGETIVDGWLRSGDVGRMDEEGFVYVQDRAKDMILRGGENVYCAEVEGTIYEHPDVHEAAVFGVPHERLGEEVAVAVLPKAGVSLSAQELWLFLEGRMAAYKVPAHVAIVGQPLPRNAAGKILKRELRERVEQGRLPTQTR
jgi:long-chain acyl-CoA synthetase